MGQPSDGHVLEVLDAMGSLAPGDILGGYELSFPVARGGMAVVWAGRVANDPKASLVAIKTLLPALTADPRFERMFLAESRLASRIVHPNVCRVLGAGEDRGILFLAMEWIHGDTLAACARARGGRVPYGVALRVGVDSARGLHAAHELCGDDGARLGVVHRDVSPQNILLGEDGVAKIVDFGVAKAVAQSQHLTQSGFLKGKVEYMAPEQAYSEPVDPRTDVFALGVVLYEATTGKHPFARATAAGTLAALSRGDPVASPATIAPDYPELLAAVIMRALAFDAKQRQQTMAELAEALEEAAEVVGAASRADVAAFVRQACGERIETLGGMPRGLEMRSLTTGDAGQVLERLPAQARSPGATRPAPGSRRRRVIASITTAGVVAAVGYFLAVPRPAHGPAAPASGTLPAPSTSTATRLTDLMAPESAAPEARAAYAAGLELIHDASLVAGLKELRRAADLDPQMVAASLRILLYGKDIAEGDPRATFMAIHEGSANLSARDRAILSAYEPSFLAVPADDAETSRRFAAIADASPRDAELSFLAATFDTGDLASANALLERSLADDPGFALAGWHAGRLRFAGGDLDGALHAFDECLVAAPSAVSCLTLRAQVFEQLGRCTDMEKDARLAELVAPSERTADLVARALFANGAPLLAVRATLGRKWAAAAPERRQEYQLDDERNLAILEGDFAAAEAIQRRSIASVEQSNLEADHEAVALPLLELYDEMGSPKAGRLADDYLKARAAWTSFGAWAPVPRMMAAALHAGLRRERDREAAVSAWRTLWDRVPPPRHDQWWVRGYAFPAATEAEAKAAMAVAPAPLPRPMTSQFHLEGLGVVGGTLLLAGRHAEALSLLRADAASCTALQAPLQYTRAHLHLGEALERTGDTPGACKQYAIVLARFGGAKPRSVSAERARQQSRALSCP